MDAVRSHFGQRGFFCTPGDPEDLICMSEDRTEKWVIEAKGITSCIGTDFQTALGQLLMGMKEPSWRYAIAVPHAKKYIFQCRKVPAWVREKLGIHILFVRPDGHVESVGPGDQISDL